MARPLKTGLNYFPFDVDFFEDDKIQLIESEFGVQGGYVAVRLLCKIYKEGYYYGWGLDQCLLFSKQIGVNKSLIDEIVKGLVRRGFFDKKCFDRFNILTSAGIQKRYISIVKSSKIKREDIEIKYDLAIPSEEIAKSSEEMPKNSEESTQRKRKEIKVKERKEKDLKKFSLSNGDLKCIDVQLFEVMEQLLDDTIWLEPICMNNKLSVIQIQDHLKNFFIYLQSKEDLNKTVKDAKDYFAKWLPYQSDKNHGKKELLQQQAVGAGITFR